MKRGLKLAIMAATVGSASMVDASSTTSGFVSNITANSDGNGYFNAAGKRSAPPSCQDSVNFPQSFAFDSRASSGQAMVAVILSAYGLHKSVVVYGTGTCSVFPNLETASAVVIVD